MTTETSTDCAIDFSQAPRQFDVLTGGTEIIEVRVFTPRGQLGGWFSPEQYRNGALVKALTPFANVATMIAATLNEPTGVEPDGQITYRQSLTKDHMIVRRRAFKLDFDPIRPGETSATDGEKAAAEKLMREVKAFLSGSGFPEPEIDDSGNGYHLLYLIDLPADSDIPKRFLKAISERFSTAAVEIDRKVHDAARVFKVMGTWARKGPNTPARPHRMARIISTPDTPEIVTAEQLESAINACVGAGGLLDQWPDHAPDHRVSVTPPPTSTNATPPYAVPSVGAVDVVERARRYIAEIPGAVSGQDGSVQTFKVAQHLVRGFALDQSTAMNLLAEWNATCSPPWSEKELRHKIENAADDSRQPVGYLLNDRPVSHTAMSPATTATSTTRSPDRILTAAERFKLHDGAALDEMDCTLDFMIHNVLVAGQPCIVAGPKKSLKTSILIEMAISLVTGSMFLGQFVVPKKRKVLLMTGESGAGTIQETARRIAEARGISLRNLEFFVCSFDLPRLADPADLARLKEIIQAGGFDVVMIDPAYLALAGLEDAGNLFAVGGMLAPLTELGKECNTTLVIAHHTKKNLGNPYEQPELGDIAWAGFAEWARQWVLLNRRGPFDPESGGHHELWLSTGGSAGHGGAWSLDITEGRRTDPGGRTWIVDLGSARAAKAERADERATERDRRKETAAEAKQVKHRERLLDVLAKFPAGETKRAIRDAAGLSGKDAEPVFLSLIEEGLVETVEIKKHNGCHPGFRLKQSTNEVGQVGLSGTDRDQSRIIPVGRDAPI